LDEVYPGSRTGGWAAGIAVVVVDTTGPVLAWDHVDRLHPALAEAPAGKEADDEEAEEMDVAVLVAAAVNAETAGNAVAGTAAAAVAVAVAVADVRRSAAAVAEIEGEDSVGVGHKAVGGIGVPDVAVVGTASGRTVEDGQQHWLAPGKGCGAYARAAKEVCVGELAAEAGFVCELELMRESAVSLTGAVESPTVCSGHLLRPMHRPLLLLL